MLAFVDHRNNVPEKRQLFYKASCLCDLSLFLRVGLALGLAHVSQNMAANYVVKFVPSHRRQRLTLLLTVYEIEAALPDLQ
jgi:hypothetical protein